MFWVSNLVADPWPPGEVHYLRRSGAGALALQAVEQRDGGTDPAVIDWRASGVEQGMDLSHARVES
ncbi:hypothetical protein D3C81_921120 [compost metagenome]